MKKIMIASAVLVSMTSVALGGDNDSNNSTTSAGVSALTRGANISTKFSGSTFPTDPIRGSYASNVAKTVPPNPTKDGFPGPGEE